MKFEVELTERADRDLRNIFLYIAVDLSSPENAEKQIKRLWDAILALDELPERYRRYEDEPWHSRGMRVLPIDNFVILYIPYLEEKVVRLFQLRPLLLSLFLSCWHCQEKMILRISKRNNSFQLA